MVGKCSQPPGQSGHPVQYGPKQPQAPLVGVKGVGSCAANHLLMLPGHYGEIPCDSEVREHLRLSPKAAQKEVEMASELAIRRNSFAGMRHQG
jgi:hypothetical protein